MWMLRIKMELCWDGNEKSVQIVPARPPGCSLMPWQSNLETIPNFQSGYCTTCIKSWTFAKLSPFLNKGCQRFKFLQQRHGMKYVSLRGHVHFRKTLKATKAAKDSHLLISAVLIFKWDLSRRHLKTR